MNTKAPAEVNYFDENDRLKKLYKTIDGLSDIITVPNDRNRLSFNINMFFNKEIGSLLNAIVQASPRSSTLSYPELEKIVENKLSENGLINK